MKQPLFPSTIGTQSRLAYFLTVKAVIRKFGKSNGQTGSRCLDKEVLAQGGGGYIRALPQNNVRWQACSETMPLYHGRTLAIRKPLAHTK